MTIAEIKKVLELHEKWLNNEQGGGRAYLREANLSEANLSWANLREANLRGADLREANLHGVYLSGAELHWANLRRANLSGANLHGVYLSGADLQEADLSGANLDFSCFPLWCGGSKFKCDTKLVYQILAHICTLDFPDDEGIKELIMPFAVKSHRAVDLGLKEEAE